MGLAHSPRIVTDGLVLALDAGNVKSNSEISVKWNNVIADATTVSSVGVITCLSVVHTGSRFFGVDYVADCTQGGTTTFDNRPPSVANMNTILDNMANCKEYQTGTYNSTGAVFGAYPDAFHACTLRFTGFGVGAVIGIGGYFNAESRQCRLTGDLQNSPVTITSPTGGFANPIVLTSDPADIQFGNYMTTGGDPWYIYWIGPYNQVPYIIRDNPGYVIGATYSSDDGGTLVFDGTDDYVILNDFDKASYGTTNFSLSLWFNADSGSYKSLFQIANSLNSHGPWIALISYSSGLRVYVNNDYRMDVPYTQDAWNNFVLTFDSSGSGLWTAYLNGSSVSTYTGPIGTNGGSATYLGHAYNNSYFDGKISNFGVQQKTLTAAEVQQNYNALRGRYGI